MNAAHAVTSEGGRTVVLGWQSDPTMKRRFTTRSSFADIRMRYHQQVCLDAEEERWTTLGRWWLGHPERRQYEGVVFSPGQAAPPGYYNLWQGFSVQPKPGDWTRYQVHLFENICNGDVTLYNYLVAWMAQGVQSPHVKPEVAVVLRSPERGTGKGVFTRYYRQLFGQHGIEISHPQHLIGRFNAHLEDCCVLVISEAFWAGSHQAESVLKSLITEESIAIERKGADLRFVRNYLRVLMTSNCEWVVPAGPDERRFLVFDVNPSHKQDTPYFAKIAAEMDNGGLAAMLYELQGHDCSDIDLRRAPQTDALTEQKLLSLDPRERWLFDKLCEGRLLPDDDGWSPEVEKDALHENYREELSKNGIREIRTQTELGTFLRKMLGPALTETRPTSDGQRIRCWQLPPLRECRDLFDKRLGRPYNWPAADLEAVPRTLKIAPQPLTGKWGSSR